MRASTRCSSLSLLFSTLLPRWTSAASASSLSPFRWLSRSSVYLRPPTPGCLSVAAKPCLSPRYSPWKTLNEPRIGTICAAHEGHPEPRGLSRTFRSSSKKTLAPEIRSRVVKSRKEGLVVNLGEIGFYESGASTMRASSVGSVNRLATVLASRSENMRIERHTDNLPIHNAHFPASWELSTSRASKLVKLFICISSRLHASTVRSFNRLTLPFDGFP
jgi:hypothetical protein